MPLCKAYNESVNYKGSVDVAFASSDDAAIDAIKGALVAQFPTFYELGIDTTAAGDFDNAWTTVCGELKYPDCF